MTQWDAWRQCGNQNQWVEIYIAPTDLTQKATTVVQPAPVYTSQAVVAKAGIEKQKDLTSSGNAQQLINTWKSASKSERQAFMAWLAEQAQ